MAGTRRDTHLGDDLRSRLRAAAQAVEEERPTRGPATPTPPATSSAPVRTSWPTSPAPAPDPAPPATAWASPTPRVAAPPAESPSHSLRAPGDGDAPKRRWVKWLVTLLTGTSLSIGGVSILPLLGGGGDNAPSHPSAPFGRSVAPSQQSGAGVALASPFGYSWSDDGSLTVEAWAYNATRYSQVAECEISIFSEGQLVAQDTFSPGGALPPRYQEAITLTFPPDKAPGRFASLDQSESEFRCRSHSV
jgi:hypothetical protein